MAKNLLFLSSLVLTLLLIDPVSLETRAQSPNNVSDCGCVTKAHLLRPVRQSCLVCPPKPHARRRHRKSKHIVRYRIVKKVIIVKKIVAPNVCDPCSQPAANTIIDDPSIGRPEKTRRNP